LLFGAFAHAPQRGAGLVAVVCWPRRHQARDFLAVARNRDLFAVLDEVEEPIKLALDQFPLNRLTLQAQFSVSRRQ
jgi:hypothetical protein